MSNIFKFITRLLLFIAFPLFTNSQDLVGFLNSQAEIKNVTRIESNEFFQAAYEIMIRQPLNHKDTTDGFFLQRVVVADKGIENPVVVITEGYNANYAVKSDYINELSPMLDANQICIEHRYFGKSVPEPLNWNYLTVENAATDQHRVIQLLRKYYSSKWISTGISKGGQTAMSHRSFFPEDVDVTVAYVGPVNFAVEDGRHEPFIAKKAGTASERKAVCNFQKEALKRKTQMLSLLKEFSEEKKYTYKMPLDKVFDFCVLEYSFSFWQWGNQVKEIPAVTATDREIFDHLMKVASSDYFSEEGIAPTLPFFVQAACELGYYGYDTKKFRNYLSIPSARNYLANIFLPEGMNPVFNPATMENLHQFIHTTNEKMMFIYGKNDPWTASGAIVPKKDNLVKMVLEGGAHRTRINSFSEEQKLKLIEILKGWIK
ncbi:MAG: hypothetical protein A2W90_11675 [Bacteroidetes bacterium GWF2_42_66]|nr:MAG: hypothetical protein A2W92_00380 [Bacteroidetes bacterium GWA2_42_15]OFY01770.1 MAG: hypothetical protein A2W89_22895 [Bacteroidetes bacterium GWE2_42_39]OFY44938.1 MAG: hypothetical protein A2W90_11675 [Bacteroidetes bacterium GWF2_42_66]HBL76068.1 aminopeptidase [Prolixibacteraceae bacterium]HCR90214.1 aminopeptidase [Prolixibacteraceae bacterium]